MANTPKKHPSGRRRKETKTIDMKANPEADEKATGSAAGSSGGPVGDKGKSTESPSSAGKTDTQKPASQESAAAKASVSSSVPSSGARSSASSSASTAKDTASSSASPVSAAAKDPSATNPASGSKATSSSSTKSEKKGGTSAFALLASGIVGGLVTLGGAGVMNATGNLQSVPVIGGLFGDPAAGGDLEAANAKIADLSARLDQLSAVSGNSDLSVRIDALETRLTEGGVGASGADVEQALAAAEAASQKADATAGKIDELTSRIVESGGGANVDMDALRSALSSESEALGERINALEARLGELDSGGGGQNAADLEAIRTQVEGLGNMGDTVSAIDAKTQELASSLAENTKQLSALGERMGALETSVNNEILPSMGEVEKAAGAAIESQKVARSVSARALGNVLEQGGKFASELAAAEALAGSSASINELRPLAEDGILTVNQLLTRFDTISGDILSAEASNSAEGGGILDKFMASARTLVQVRPAGPVSGDSTAAILSRVEAALKQGDLTTAKNEWSGLDETAKAMSSDWAAQLDARLKAQELIETVIGELSAGQNGQQG